MHGLMLVSTAIDSSPCNTVLSYSRFCVENLTINAVKSYGKAGPIELSSDSVTDIDRHN